MGYHHSSFTLLLTCLAGIFASERVRSGTMVEIPYGPMSVEIHGRDILTVGVPYGFWCRAKCFPACTFTWIRDNVTSHGPELNVRFEARVGSQVLTCIAVNPTTKTSVTVHKTLELTVGPSNIKMTGPTWLTDGVASNFTCSADCYPPCNYTLILKWKQQTLRTLQGNTISFKPNQGVDYETLVCEAHNTASDMFISTSLQLPVAKLHDMYIYGPSSVKLGETHQFTCMVTCLPSCNYTWTLGKRIFHGNLIQAPIFHKGAIKIDESKLQVTISDYSHTEPLICEAQNTASGATINSTKILTVTDPISVRPASQELPVAGQTFSLQCVGSQNPASTRWLKDGVPIPVSNRVHLSAHNTTLSFSPLQQSDSGKYQCEVTESGMPIKSVVHQVEVNCGPTSVKINGPDTVTVGVLYEFQCSAQCFPNCTFTWIRDNVTSHGPELSLRLSVRVAAQVLTCIAVNPTTGTSVTVHKTLQVAVGLSNIKITGPTELFVGVAYAFTCSADCYPSCSYTWMVKGNNGLILSTSQGNTISIKPSHGDDNETLVCEAHNSASDMFFATSLQLSVASVSVRPVSHVLPVAGQSFSLQCVGSQNPASIKWLKDGVPIPVSNRVHLSAHNTTLTFSPLNKSDTGMYQCQITESGVSIKSVGHQVEVNYGPTSVKINGSDTVTVGVLYEFQCSAQCFPNCTFTWIRDNVTSHGPELSLRLKGRVAAQVLTCIAVNPTTGSRSVTVHKTLQVAVGLSNIKITGPTELFVGVASNFTCSADCYPSCNYTWMVKWNGEVLRTSQGNTISIKPSHGVDNETLVCEAHNTASDMFIATSLQLPVSFGLSNIKIIGPTELFVGVASNFTCSADCYPSCNYTWMVKWKGLVLRTSQGNTISIKPSHGIDNETLVCEARNTASDMFIATILQLAVASGPTSVEINGSDTVTVGVLYEFQCSAQCFPNCTFTWIRNNVTSHGPELSLRLKGRVAAQVLTCIAVNPTTGTSVTVHKTLQVAVGLSNIKITGPTELFVGVASNFTCSADCYPSCNYTWMVKWNGDILRTSQGNTISVKPSHGVDNETVVCEAHNTASDMFIATSLQVPVSFGLSNIKIIGPTELFVGVALTFTCSADCYPSCNYTWMVKWNREVLRTSQGNTISVKPSHGVDNETLVCEARNTASDMFIATSLQLAVASVSVRPVSHVLPVAGQSFSLQCVGSQNPASIKWLKDGVPIPVSNRIHLSAHNTTLTFSPLQQSDSGMYQCEVTERGVSLKSVGYKVKVNFGPQKMAIKSNKGPVGKELDVLPGSTTALECSADCYPACSYSWYYNDGKIASNASLPFTPVAPPNEAALICVAYNSVTKQKNNVETTVIIPDGPLNVSISGPDAIEVGVQASFTCTAKCSPSCSYTWSVYGRRMTGSVIDISINHYVDTEFISCQAQNTLTGHTAVVNETISVYDPHWCGC